MDIPVQSSKEVAPKKKPPTNKRQVVVTGMGLETSIGRDPDVFYSNLLEGVSGISEIEAFNCSQFPTVCLACDIPLFFWTQLVSMFTLRSLITENSRRDQVLLDRWLGCTQTF